MKKNYSNIEDLFKNSFTDYRVSPPEGMWGKINLKLNVKQFFSTDFKHFNIYYLSAVLGIISAIGILFSDVSENTVSTSISLVQKTHSEISSRHSIDQNVSINQRKNEINNKLTIAQNPKIEKQRISETETSRVFEVIPFTQNQKLKTLAHLSEDSLSKLNQITVSPPKPLFKLSNKEGCAPFEIRLQNFSELAQNYEWDFGDGNKSGDVNPLHTYLYPGVYTINLKAIGLGGVAYSIIDSVVVHESVINKFSTSFKNKLAENELFTVSTKTNQPAEYEWNFGDGSYSNKNNPTHIYSDEGNYTISLKTWTTNNCFDSVKVADVIVAKSNERIIFPNAFSPNPNGPSSGKYSKQDVHNDIFHPVVKGEIEEYNLKIFSRTGVILFESNDIFIGWDGYYQNRLMPTGVYPYIVSGKFEGGKSFLERGNVTIIYRK